MKRFLIIALLAFTVGIFAQCGDEGTSTPPDTNANTEVAAPDLGALKAEYKKTRKAYKALPKGSKERKAAYKEYKAAKKAYKAAKS